MKTNIRDKQNNFNEFKRGNSNIAGVIKVILLETSKIFITLFDSTLNNENI